MKISFMCVVVFIDSEFLYCAIGHDIMYVNSCVSRVVNVDELEGYS